MRGAALMVLALLAGCAGPRGPAVLPEAGAPVELVATPFFAQRQYQCGPAALATALGADGVEISPDALVSEIYLPDRKGSLQAEIVAATRRHGRVAAPVGRSAADIVTELRAGQPVLVLLNLGLSWLPVWHYAVVVGYEPDHGEFVLRSGTERRARMPVGRFEAAWAYGEHWGVVITSAAHIPVTTSINEWLAAIAPLESLGKTEAAAQGYRAATERWPASALAWTALGNAQARLEKFDAAVTAYDSALARAESVAAYNNRADALGHLGCRARAELDLQRASQLDEGGRYREVLARTRAGLPATEDCPAAMADVTPAH